MGIAGTLINSFVVLAVGSLLTYVTHGWRAESKAEAAALRHDLKSDLARLESRIDSIFTALHSDLTAVALAVGAEKPGSSTGSGGGQR